MRNLSTPVLAIAVAFAFAVTLVPVASADHAYSHRYAIFGTLVDSEGDPIPNVTISLSLSEGFRYEGQCSNQPGSGTDAFPATQNQPTTNGFGQFMFCLHAHTIARDTTEQIRLDATGTGASRVVNVDPELRVSYVVLQTSAPGGSAPPIESHLVQGRAWRPSASPVSVEAINVFGDTVQQAPVTIRMPGLDPVETTTNNYGDFAVRIPLPDGETPGGDIEIIVNGTTFLSPVDVGARVNYEPLRLDPLPAPTPATPAPTTAPTATPTATPRDPSTTTGLQGSSPTRAASATPATEAPTPTATPSPTPTSSSTALDTPFPWQAAVALALVVAFARGRSR